MKSDFLLPEDVKEIGTVEVNQNDWQFVYHSVDFNFTGTAWDFVQAGIGFVY